MLNINNQKFKGIGLTLLNFIEGILNSHKLKKGLKYFFCTEYFPAKMFEDISIAFLYTKRNVHFKTSLKYFSLSWK